MVHRRNGKACERDRANFAVLAQTPLLAGCPEAFLWRLLESCIESAHREGDVLATVMEPADSMLVVLKGSMELEAKNGTKVATLRSGGCVGESQVLGLMNTWTVTVRALEDTWVLAVTFQGLESALGAAGSEDLQKGFARLLEARRSQVESGQPLLGLPSVRIGPTDTSARLMNLQAEHLQVESGDAWKPVPSSDPNGPRVSLILRGRVSLELGERPEELTLRPGMVIPERLVAEFGAVFRAQSQDCEVYRIRVFDMLAAANSMQQVSPWFYQLRMMEREAHNRLQPRLVNLKGVAMSRMHHKSDAHIRQWKEKRLESLRHAKALKERREELLEGERLPPLLPHREAGTTAFRSWSRGDKRLAAVASLPQLAPGVPIEAMRLPKVRSDLGLRAVDELQKKVMLLGL